MKKNAVGTTNEAVRREWLARVLGSIPAGSKILDAGAGELANKEYCAHLEYVSQDFCQYDGSGDSNALQMDKWDTSEIDIVSDITAIPAADGAFDVVLCSEVLEHVPDPVRALKELCRLVNDTGTIIFTAPFCSLTHFSPYHFSSGFNRYFYEHHLRESGFAITELASNGNYFEYSAQELRRLPSILGQYSGVGLGPFFNYAMRYILWVLQRASAVDNGSSSLLCFGYHVVARRTG